MEDRPQSGPGSPERADAGTAAAGKLGRTCHPAIRTPERGNLRIRRIYRAPRNSDGRRILVDRIWPRGISKDRARLDGWMKEIAPSDALRKWFHADPAQWGEFRRQYFAELAARMEEIDLLHEMARDEVVTLLFAAADTQHNNAAVLRDFLLGHTVSG